MRLAAVSDIHGNLPALQAVVRDIERRGGVDAIVNLGDCVSGPLLPRETAQFLMARRDWTHLAGNHERQLLGDGPHGASDAHARAQLGACERAWLAALSPFGDLAGLDPQVRLCHGTPTSDLTYLLETVTCTGLRAASAAEIDARLGASQQAPGQAPSLILCGHTHVPRAVRTAAGTLIVNPGSVGLPAYEDDRPHPHVVENGAPDARYALLDRVDGRWQSALVSVAYDHAAMARLATERGRPDWAIALMTGRMTP